MIYCRHAAVMPAAEHARAADAARRPIPPRHETRMSLRPRTSVAAAAVSAALAAGIVSGPAGAAEIQFWHAMSNRLNELLDEQVAKFNESQDEHTVVATNKGDYSETLNAGIAAFRAGEQPTLLQVFEVGTATMMNATGAIKPVYELMEETGTEFDPAIYLAAVKGYYTTTDGEMLSLPYNSSTPVLYVNEDALADAGAADMPLETWEDVGAVLDELKAAGSDCPMTTAWQSWIHLENLSAYHDVPFATEENGFAGLDAKLEFDQELQKRHIANLGQWAKDGKFIYAGRRNEGGARFRSGECALFTESSAGYAGVAEEAQFDFSIRQLPYYADVEGAPRNTIIGGASIWAMAGKSDDEYAAAAAFLNFLSTPDIQAQWHQDTGYLPITTAAYEQTKASGFYEENPGTDVAILQMTGKEPTANSKGIRLGNFDQIRGVIDEGLESVWSGDASADAALDTAAERGDELLTRFERTAGR